MRRLALLVAGGALWLLAAAVPVLADGGPHISTINNGSGGLTADTCAGCHRAHTAQGALLLKEEGTALCTSCHGSAGTGATTNVADGVQYRLATGGDTVRGAELGALRGGGFVLARIGSSYPSRMLLSTSATPGTGFAAFIPAVASGSAITSEHMSLTSSGPAIAWGNGANSMTPKTGATVTLECTSCHNPHGNGNYRILNPMPFSDSQGAYPAGFSGPAAPGIVVTDAALPPDGSVRNYTVQPGVLAGDVTGAVTDGDYWRRCSPDWQNCSGQNRGDKPNGLLDLPPGDLGLVQHLSLPLSRRQRQRDGRGRTEPRCDLRLPAPHEHHPRVHPVPRVTRVERVNDRLQLQELHRPCGRRPPERHGDLR